MGDYIAHIYRKVTYTHVFQQTFKQLFSFDFSWLTTFGFDS